MRDRDEPTDWDLAEGLDPDGPSAEDLHRFGDELIACASCGREVYDQAEICPICGGPVYASNARTPWWVIGVAVVLVAVLVYAWVL